MNELYRWLQRMVGGDETTAAIVAAAIGAIVLGVAIFHGVAALLWRLDALRDRCPGCGRRTLEVRGFDENDEDEADCDYFYRCRSCEARYRQRPGGEWEDASDPKFDAMFIGDAAVPRVEPLWDDDLDA